MRYDVAVIGGGASGLMAATAAASLGATVIIIEHGSRLGKKILATGNGRCNFTNLDQDIKNYRTKNEEFVRDAFLRFGRDELIGMLGDLGLISKEAGGYFYPYSENARDVLDIILLNLKRLEVNIMLDAQIFSVKKEGSRFRINIKDEEILDADRVVFATGGRAAPKTGSDGSGYRILRKLGHSITPLYPALVPLEVEENFKDIAGVRTDADISLLIDGELSEKEFGQLQITDYGLSGIPVFQLSRFAAEAVSQGKNVEAGIDYFRDYSKEDIMEQLEARRKYKAGCSVVDALAGMLNRKLLAYLIRAAGISPDAMYRLLGDKELRSILKKLKGHRVKIKKPLTFERAQTTAGGIPLSEIKKGTFESGIVEGLYLCGELLDVDGRCGGYNLQWAFTSGYIAGSCAGR